MVIRSVSLCCECSSVIHTHFEKMNGFICENVIEDLISRVISCMGWIEGFLDLGTLCVHRINFLHNSKI